MLVEEKAMMVFFREGMALQRLYLHFELSRLLRLFALACRSFPVSSACWLYSHPEICEVENAAWWAQTPQPVFWPQVPTDVLRTNASRGRTEVSFLNR